ncbi:hypothetical protein R1sor_001864 [Riccia sorocarpa]|uniref:Reverse transcriptase domain-containing protein n=1 Tax=Riccia sorocarpa TaxID=122646 RepID=A0ABD3H0A0_9MARC
MVDLANDSGGPAAVAKGSELQQWCRLVEMWNMIDCRLADGDQSEALMIRLEELEQELRTKENQEAEQWRRRSRARWLKDGDAPSQYFFSQLKAKHQREGIKLLTLDNGEVIQSEERILNEIEVFYADLYQQDEEVDGNQKARERILSFISTEVTSNQNHKLVTVPTMEELEEIVKRLPEEKALGLDGATTEILRKCLSFMKGDCLKMLESFWADGECAYATKQEAVLIKLDFEKAYDRVSHAYLESVLTKMQFAPHFIRLIRGLLKTGAAIVHTNGLFTGEVQLGRGVQQGCTIAPFMFALCTEPLMGMLRAYQNEGLLQGIKLPGGRHALYNLFADDTELSIQATESNYREVKGILRHYEHPSGAKLNVRKSAMIPTSMQEIPLWLTRTGCKIARDGEIVLHLGFPGGIEIKERQISMYLEEKIHARTSSWTNRWLTWTGRIVLAQKIMPSLHAYVLMTFDLSAKGYKALENIWRTFIWEQGRME